ncbi:MAG: pentapeptide repeat-containing protein [Polyangiaceae bacterium]
MDDLPKVQAVVDELLAHSFTWSRFRGALYATATLKATVALVHGKPAEVVRPEAFRWIDKTRVTGSIERPDEGAPFLGAAEVLVYGFMYAFGASRAQPALARVMVGVDRPLVDKSIASDRNGKIPLLWEEALVTSDNPVGTEEPRLIHPRDATRAVGLGPMHPTWQPRVQFLSAPIVRHSDVLELCDPLDPRYFNAAPADQQCPFFQGTEGIQLTSLVANVVDFRTWLPALSVRARAGVDGVPTQLAFALDTLAIDADALRANLLWRTAIPLPRGARNIAFQAELVGGFDRARVLAPPEPEKPVAPTVAPVVVVQPLPPAPTRPKVRPPLISVADARGAVMDRLGRGLPMEGLDLSNGDLSGLDLTGKSLAYSKLEGANLSRARLDRADLEGADLSRVKAQKVSFVGANLANAKLVQAELEGATFDEADLSDADLTRALLMDAKLRRARANRAKFERATLVNADLVDASLDFAVLEKSSIDEANFGGATLADANLAQSVGAGVRFTKARLARANLRQVRWSGAVLTGADLAGANLEKADLSSARLDDATLDGATGPGAKLARADLSRATMRGAILQGADLTGARLVGVDRSSANLEGAILKAIHE